MLWRVRCRYRTGATPMHPSAGGAEYVLEFALVCSPRLGADPILSLSLAVRAHNNRPPRAMGMVAQRQAALARVRVSRDSTLSKVSSSRAVGSSSSRGGRARADRVGTAVEDSSSSSSTGMVDRGG